MLVEPTTIPPVAAGGRRHPGATPPARGPLSGALLAGLTGATAVPDAPELPARAPEDVVVDDDLQLALYCIHELAYRGFDDVDADLEVHPAVHAWRLALEAAFEAALRDLTVDTVRWWLDDPVGYLTDVGTDAGWSLSHELLATPDRDRFAEILVHRSGYQLKEADPHSWALPRTSGASKAALVEIQMDEYGAGRPGAAHAELFAETMRHAGLDGRYGAHLDRLPGVTLATTNLISLFGRRRRLLPALLGHLALFENTSVGPMARWAELCTRLGLPDEARAFYDVHVAADAHHGPLARHRLVGGHLREHPGDGAEVVFGAAAVGCVERMFTEHLRTSWSAGASSLLPPGGR